MDSPLPLTRDLVFVGGGHAHALVLRKWGMDRLPGARLTLINPDPAAPYTGMLPGHVAGHYAKDALMIDLVRLARFAGARLILGKAHAMDLEAKLIHVTDRPPIRYDLASIDVGITADMPMLPGFAQYGVGAKPLDQFAVRWEAYVADVSSGKKSGAVAVIGGGVAGCELAMAMAHRLGDTGVEPQVAIIERENALTGVDGGARAILFERLRAAGIRIFERTDVARLDADGIVTEAGGIIRAEFTVGAAGARPHDWLADLGLDHQGGFLVVDKYLRSVSDTSVYAAGDCALMRDAPRPKAGVFAVRQAPILFHNLRADLTRAQRRAYEPQKRFLKLISLGSKDAVAEGYGIAPSGPWLWRLKDKIDQDFMDKFRRLPPMPKPPLPRIRAQGLAAEMAGQPMCGGCGSKVALGRLTQVLDDLPGPGRADVDTGPGDDAAILTVGGQKQVVSTDHLRAFTDDPVLLAQIAANHAMGDIWAMGAAPQAATANIIIPRMTAALQSATLREIMATAAKTFRSAGADLVGGHTTIGAELTIGFTVTGLCDAPPIGQSGALPGDALILTRPIGAGTILAAEMQSRAKGEWVANVWRHMGQPQGAAARILAKSNAMTDVTGFGLAGHLLRICRASSVGAELAMTDVPLYPGALDLAEQGLRSTLFEANRQDVIGSITGTTDTARTNLLFDPQTAGGLLAAVSPDTTDTLIKQLRGAGFHARQIGTVTDASGQITLA